MSRNSLAPPRCAQPPHSAATKAVLADQARITHAIKNPARAVWQLNKEIAECSLIEYAKLLWPVLEPGREMKDGWAIRAICDHLEAVTRGDIKKLLINVPPGMMKSLLTQVIWPSWEWGPKDMPWLRYVSASYSADLTIRDNRRAKQLLESELYQELWGNRFSLTSDQHGKVRYDNDKRGFRIATSVGGLGTGERGDRFIIDDPHNVKTAESEADLESKAQWFTEVVPSRVNDLEESAFIIIMQRVHERDISGLIKAYGLPYVHLELPMEFEPSRRCHTVLRPGGLDGPRGREEEPGTFVDPRTEEGELLFPERFKRKGVDDLKTSLSSWGGEYAVAGQLQQRPAPRGGGMFKRDACGDPVDCVPEGARRCRGWDIAGSTRKTSPFTAGVKLALVGGTYYVEAVTRERKEIEAAEDHIVKTAWDDTRSTKQSLPQDPGSAGKSQKAHMTKALDGLDFTITPESGEKSDRAIGIASQWNNGNVKMVKGDWNDAFLNELATFPRGAFKDQVDALSRAYSELILKRMPTLAGAPELAPGLSTSFADDEDRYGLSDADRLDY